MKNYGDLGECYPPRPTRRLGFWLSFLQLSWFLRWVCYLHFTSNDGFNGFQQIHEDLQVGAAIQENLFTVEVSRLCVWIFVACYTAAPKLASLQDFVFVPGYALCAPAHLSEIGKMFHYAFVVICFLLIPLLTAIFSYIKISKTIQQHNADVSTTIQRREIFSHITTRLQNSPYFSVFKYARAVKQKVWNGAENRERDWGETLKNTDCPFCIRYIRSNYPLLPATGNSHWLNLDASCQQAVK